MRRLSQKFIVDLGKGFLNPILDRVIADRSLCLEIRNDYVNIYYRGGNLIKLEASTVGYIASFDKKYFKGGNALSQTLPAAKIQEGKDVEAWISVMPMLKQAIDLHPTVKEEREVQQLILRDNNFSGVSRKTDYYICDIEYQTPPHGRFDMVAVHWPSTPTTRKKPNDRRLVLVEVKYGENAILDSSKKSSTKSSGIHTHIKDINNFLGNAENLENFKGEMVDLFNQKRSLGLVNCGKDLVSFSDDPPILLLVFVNYDPDSSILRTCLESLPDSPHADLYLSTGCLMGYGLFNQAVMPLADAVAKFQACIDGKYSES